MLGNTAIASTNIRLPLALVPRHKELFEIVNPSKHIYISNHVFNINLLLLIGAGYNWLILLYSLITNYWYSIQPSLLFTLAVFNILLLLTALWRWHVPMHIGYKSVESWVRYCMFYVQFHIPIFWCHNFGGMYIWPYTLKHDIK